MQSVDFYMQLGFSPVLYFVLHSVIIDVGIHVECCDDTIISGIEQEILSSLSH